MDSSDLVDSNTQDDRGWGDSDGHSGTDDEPAAASTRTEGTERPRKGKKQKKHKRLSKLKKAQRTEFGGSMSSSNTTGSSNISKSASSAAATSSSYSSSSSSAHHGVAAASGSGLTAALSMPPTNDMMADAAGYTIDPAHIKLQDERIAALEGGFQMISGILGTSDRLFADYGLSSFDCVAKIGGRPYFRAAVERPVKAGEFKGLNMTGAPVMVGDRWQMPFINTYSLSSGKSRYYDHEGFPAVDHLARQVTFSPGFSGEGTYKKPMIFVDRDGFAVPPPASIKRPAAGEKRRPTRGRASGDRGKKAKKRRRGGGSADDDAEDAAAGGAAVQADAADKEDKEATNKSGAQEPEGGVTDDES